MASTDVFKEAIFDEVAEQADSIRNKLEGAIYYGISIDSFPNREDAILAIAYNLRFMESLAVSVEMPEDKPEKQTSFADAAENKRLYPNYEDTGGEY